MYTLEHLYHWAEEVEQCMQKETSEITWALIGNKCDLIPEVNDESVRILSKDRLKTELSFFVSAKSGENVKDAFEAIVAAAHRKHLALRDSATEKETKSSVTLHLTTKKNCSC